jgi:hypothetical protein
VQLQQFIIAGRMSQGNLNLLARIIYISLLAQRLDQKEPTLGKIGL